MEKYTKEWWKRWFCRATIRAGHAFGQTFLGFVLVDGWSNTFKLLELDWIRIIAVCVIATIISYVKSFVVGVPELEEE